MPLTYDSHAEAKAHLQEGQVVAGAYLDDEMTRAAYFCVPEDLDKASMTALAFEVRYGKPMDGQQRWALSEAARRG